MCKRHQLRAAHVQLTGCHVRYFVHNCYVEVSVVRHSSLLDDYYYDVQCMIKVSSQNNFIMATGTLHIVCRL